MTLPSARERDLKVYRAYCAAAEHGLPAPTCDELCALLDDGDGGPVVATTVNITRRLEKRSLIRVRRYQRYREVQIVATGRWTANARCRTLHWRLVNSVSEGMSSEGIENGRPADFRRHICNPLRL